MGNEREKQMIEQLYWALSRLESAEESRMLLEDLCTFREIEQMAQRLESAKMLLDGKTYIQVMDDVEVSSATLSRVSRCVQYGSGGYSQVFARMLKEEANDGH